MSRDLLTRVQNMHKLSSTPMSLLLGVDEFFRDLDEMTNRATATVANCSGYPPFNIKRKDNEYLIELALAGFTRDDINISLNPDNNILSILGSNAKTEIEGKNSSSSAEESSGNKEEWSTLYKGIAKRKFKQEFKLPRGAKVKEAKMTDGMLSVNVELPLPERKEVVSIKIK